MSQDENKILPNPKLVGNIIEKLQQIIVGCKDLHLLPLVKKRSNNLTSLGFFFRTDNVIETDLSVLLIMHAKNLKHKGKKKK